MPTLIQQRGFEIRIYTRDHEPAHVHCWKAKDELIVTLDSLEIRANTGMSKRDTVVALSIVAAHREMLLAAWNRIHP